MPDHIPQSKYTIFIRTTITTTVVDRTMVRQVLTLTFRAAIFSPMKLNALHFSSEGVFMWQVHSRLRPRLRPRLLYRLLDSSRAISPDVWFGPTSNFGLVDIQLLHQ